MLNSSLVVLVLQFLYLSKHYRVGSILRFGRTRSTKQCYLFALVAGQLASRDDMFTTCSGRKVALRIWTPPPPPAEDLPKNRACHVCSQSSHDMG
ncbi:putative cytosol alanyl aminopeptidase [Helianthus anomalus]